ncbi:MAG: protein kinase [Myxococcota bacterium]
MGETEDSRSIGDGSIHPSEVTQASRSGGPPEDAAAALQELVARKVKKQLFGGPNSTRTIGRYTVLDTLGEGGMGTVLRGFDPELDRQVALKVLQSQISHREAARLRREAQAMARLSHPNVVQVYEVGESNGRIFVAMELVAGQTLREWMKEGHGWRECVALFISLGEGLAAAHEGGLVHRDFKPGNALIDTKGRPRVLDFGLARQTDGYDDYEDDPSLSSVRNALVTTGEAVLADTPLTKTGAVVGTPAYMSPEQYHGDTVDTRSDQFSFCVTMYEALYGERPFAGSELENIMEAVRLGELTPVAKGRSVPRALRKILVRGMALDPNDRWPSIDALLSELRAMVASRWRAWAVAGLASVLLATGGALAAAAYLGDDGISCDGLERELQGVWDPQRKQGVEAAFTATQAEGAAQTWAEVEAGLDDYTRRWVAVRTDACRAAARPEQALDAVVADAECLEDQRLALRETVDALTDIDADGVSAAASRVSRLATPGDCRGGDDALASVEGGEEPSDSASASSDVLLLDDCPYDPSLALCLRFESIEGSTVYEDTNPSIRGEISGDARIEPGPHGNALVLPGHDGRLTLDRPINPPGSFSIDLQLWMNDGAQRWSGIVDNWIKDEGIWLGVTTRPGGLAFWVDGVSISIEDVPKDRWIHVLATFDVGTGVMSMYVDGKLVALGQHSGPATPRPGPMILGWGVDDDAPFGGKVDTVRIWHRVLEPPPQ